MPTKEAGAAWVLFPELHIGQSEGWPNERGKKFLESPGAAATGERGSGEPLHGPKKKTKAAQTRGEPSRHLTLENADACLKISSAESASSSPRS